MMSCATKNRGMNDTHDMKRLLVFEMRMLGDAIISTPFVRSAVAAYDVFICCNDVSEQTFGTLVPRDHLIRWRAPWIAEKEKYKPSRWKSAELRDLVRQLRGVRADIAVSVWPDPREHVFMALSGARTRLGFPMTRQNYLAHERPWRRRHLRAGRVVTLLAGCALLRPLLTRKLARNSYRQAHIEDWRQLAQALGLEWNIATPWFPVSGFSPPAGDRLERVCAGARASGEKIWLLHTGARLPSKCWPHDRFQEVVDTVFAPKNAPLIIIKPPEGPCPTPRNDRQVVVETPSVGEFVAVMNRADAVLCNDSAASHLAAALGKKVIAIFGSGDPAWFAPSGNESRVVISRTCPHHPCMDRCEMPSYVCQESVTTAMVREAIEREQ